MAWIFTEWRVSLIPVYVSIDWDPSNKSNLIRGNHYVCVAPRATISVLPIRVIHYLERLCGGRCQTAEQVNGAGLHCVVANRTHR